VNSTSRNIPVKINDQTALDICAQESNERSKIALAAIAGSAGAIRAMRTILSNLPADFPVPILYLQHLNASQRSDLAVVLQYRTALSVRWARHGERCRSSVVYLCPPGCNFTVRPDGTIALTALEASRDIPRPADRFFSSVAASYGPQALVIMLSGAGSDGCEGVRAVRAEHGTVLVQDESSADVWGMPQAAVGSGCVDLVLPLRDIAPLLINLVRDGHTLGTVRQRASSLASNRMDVSANLHNALEDLLAKAITIQGADLGNIQLVDSDSGALAIAAQRGFGLDFLEYFRMVRLEDNSACARAMGNRAPVVIEDVSADPLFAAHRDIARAAQFRAVQSIPLLRRNGTLLGVLSTHYRDPRGFTCDALQSIEYARYAAHIVERLNGG
jgi:hypothetical protein